VVGCTLTGRSPDDIGEDSLVPRPRQLGATRTGDRTGETRPKRGDLFPGARLGIRTGESVVTTAVSFLTGEGIEYLARMSLSLMLGLKLPTLLVAAEEETRTGDSGTLAAAGRCW